MFLRDLTLSERRAFLGLAKQLIQVDGHEALAELHMLQSMEVETGIAAADIPATPPTAEVLSAFADPKAKAAVLLELLGLAYADEKYQPSESEFVQAVATGVGISETRLLQMESWVLRQMSLAIEAQGFMNGES